MALPDVSVATIYIVVATVVGLLFALWLFRRIAAISLDSWSSKNSSSYGSLNQPLVDAESKMEAGAGAGAAAGGSDHNLVEIYEAIRKGANAFLFAEYRICFIFIAVFGLIVFLMVAQQPAQYVGLVKVSKSKSDWVTGLLTAVSFIVGGSTSIVSGYLGMWVAVYSNARTTVSAVPEGAAGWKNSFSTAFRAGAVMGFALCALALIMCYALASLYALRDSWKFYGPSVKDKTPQERAAIAAKLFEALAGYGLGGSSIAMFGRVGGGIYTKAADVGADLAGKVVSGIPEDDPRNPATIADNVGDNVGDVAGMGSDLFGSFAEATCAALLVGSTSVEIVATGWTALVFPLLVSATGIFVCLLTHFFATDIFPVTKESQVETALKTQIGVSTLFMTAALYPITFFLPTHFMLGAIHVTRVKVFFCVASGLWGGCIIGFITEYFTSHSYRPTQEVAESTETGAATNIIYGLALGYKSAIIPVFVLAIDVYVSFRLAGMYGISLAALGMLSTLATCLSIDVYGPVCDNAGGIAEMAGLDPAVRDKTDALDAAGNTTAAVGKGFAIGSAALVSLALFGAFVTRIQENQNPNHPVLPGGVVNILEPMTFAGLLVGAMIPYWFTALTMKSVGVAAMEMVKEVERQFRTIPGLLEGTPGHAPADHAKCIKISTDASLREMIAPGALVMVTPLLVGVLFGVTAVCGVLAGALVSGVQIAISASNTGGAWDNAKKYVEKGQLKIRNSDGVMEVAGKGSEAHKAAVVGDTVGDPLKDTSGPALNIVMKLMAVESVVFANFFLFIRSGHGAFGIYPQTA